VTFIFAFILTSLGLSALNMLLREPEPPTMRAPARLMARLKDFPKLIMSDRGYMCFLLVQMLSTAGRLAVPFYIIYASATIQMTGANLGLLSLAYLGADTLSNLIWGYLGDKTGFRLVLLFSLISWIAATVLLMNVHDMVWTFVAFFGLGAGQSGYMMAAQTMILEFGERDDLPMRIAISATAEGIMASIGPLVGGIMATALGYLVVFGTSIGFLAAGLLLLLVAVKEPRTARLARV
jgi:MFS family permease